MKAFHLTAALGALVFAPGPAGAQHPVIVPYYSPPPPPPQGRMHGLRHPIFLIDRDYVPVYVQGDAGGDSSDAPPAAVPPPPTPAPRKPYVVGRSYSSLPGGCLKQIQDGSSYYGCNGKWYRQAGGAYQAVAQP